MPVCDMFNTVAYNDIVCVNHTDFLYPTGKCEYRPATTKVIP